MIIRLNIVIRTDAALHIGTGHVMRCLTLANELKKRGVESLFVCREHDGHLAQLINSQGYQCFLLPKPSKAINKLPEKDNAPSHGAWLGEEWQTDFEQTRDVLDRQTFDWVIVDHYALDFRWESAMRTLTNKLMVIDDLLDRKHDCDLLLDQTLGRLELSYRPYVPEACIILAGAQYALLRPEFRKWREFSLNRRRKEPRFKNVLINFGGIDSTNITGSALDVLSQCDLPPEINIVVVMGLTAPFLEQIREKARHMPFATEVKVNVQNMSELMANSDLAIGAAGSTTWERCCLGVPSIMVVLAENQQDIALALRHAKAAIVCEDIRNLGVLIKDINTDILKLMSENASMITTGDGVIMVADELRKISCQ